MFNDRADVSATTAKKVRQAAADLGYRAPVGKGVSDRVSIWVTVDTLNNCYAPQVMSGMLLEGHSRSAITMVSQVHGATRTRAHDLELDGQTEANWSGPT